VRRLAIFPVQHARWRVDHPALRTAVPTGARLRAVVMNVSEEGGERVITIS